MLYKMIAYYLKSNQTSILERLVLHLNPANLDPENILVVCEQYSLMTAFCSLNSYIGDYTRPLKSLFALMDANVKDEGLAMYYFYKLMWYSRLCFRGERFPEGIVAVGEDIIAWLVRHHEFLIPLDSECYFEVIEHRLT